jgi:hypothetical protein
MSAAKSNPDSIVESILKGDNPKEVVKTKRGTFTMRYPTAYDLRRIQNRKASMLGDSPADRYTSDALFDMEVHATLDVVITDGPEWWMNMRDASKCPDPGLIGELYGRYLRLVKATRDRIAADSYGESPEGDKP